MKQKNINMHTIKECFNIILSGNKDDSRLAARRVRKLLYSSRSGRDQFNDIANLVDNAPHKYTKISEDWRKENFVVAISVIYYLHNREEQPDFLFSWFFQLLQHPNGVIRYAVVRMFTNELGPLTVHLRVPDYRSKKLEPEQSNNILHTLFMSLNGLLSALFEPKYKKYKYIDSLPTSPYKSVQMVLAKLEEYCGEQYIDSLL